LGVRNFVGFNQRAEEARRKGEAITRTVQTGFDKETGEAVYETEEFDLEPLPYIVVIILRPKAFRNTLMQLPLMMKKMKIQVAVQKARATSLIQMTHMIKLSPLCCAMAKPPHRTSSAVWALGITAQHR
jgi:hypothetical protein